MQHLRQKLKKPFTISAHKKYNAPAMIENDTAVIVIDVQEKICNPAIGSGTPETIEVANKLRKELHKFRDAGIPVYMVYLSHQDISPDKIDFYPGVYDPQRDVLTRKGFTSAFDRTELTEILKKHKRKNLLICGFNLNVCVSKTARDAKQEGFNVSVLRDISGNDRDSEHDYRDHKLTYTERHLLRLEKEGIAIINSKDALHPVKTKKTKEPNP